MGIIQSAVNQALTTVGMAARLSPEYEINQEKYKNERAAKNLSKQFNVQENALYGSTDPVDQEEILNDMEGNIKTGLEHTFKRFQLDPTKKNYDRFVNTRRNMGKKIRGLKYDYQSLVQSNYEAAISEGVEAAQAAQSQAYQQDFIDSVNAIRAGDEEIK